MHHLRGTFYLPLFSLYKDHVLISVIKQSIVTYYLLYVKYNSFEVIWVTQNDDTIKLTRSLSFIWERILACKITINLRQINCNFKKKIYFSNEYFSNPYIRPGTIWGISYTKMTEMIPSSTCSQTSQRHKGVNLSLLQNVVS